MKEKHTMVRVVQIASGLFVLLGCLTLFIYSPFYSKMIVYLLNTFVAVDVNEVAAKSQRVGSFSDSETLEPGSNLWIARQAYLKALEEEIKQNNSKHITYIQMRYKELTDLIKDENLKAKEEQRPEVVKVPLSSTEPEPVGSEVVVQDSSQVVKELLELNRSENKALMDKYKDFLLAYADDQLDSTSEVVSSEDIKEISEIKNNKTDSIQAIEKSKPYAIVVLGGGLTLDKKGKDIIVNNYTKLRLEKTLEIEKKYHLPIVLSGVEAPYMQKWLKNYNVDANLLEDRSMNTCENSRFSSLLLQKKGGAPTVILITDQYHMPRTRRLFALNGIETIPVEAPIPTELTTWRPSLKNYDHSRRANYEALATIRDVFFGLSDCREIP